MTMFAPPTFVQPTQKFVSTPCFPPAPRPISHKPQRIARRSYARTASRQSKMIQQTSPMTTIRARRICASPASRPMKFYRTIQPAIKARKWAPATRGRARSRVRKMPIATIRIRVRKICAIHPPASAYTRISMAFRRQA